MRWTMALAAGTGVFHHFHQPRLGELLLPFVHRFGHAVRAEHEHVAGMQRQRDLVVLGADE
jgi:hypothetical protein